MFATPTFKLIENEPVSLCNVDCYVQNLAETTTRSIHPLGHQGARAREIAPEKWAAFDSSPSKDGNGIDKYYAQREFGLNASMSIAAKLLDAGWVNRDRPMLWNDAQLDRFVSGSQHHKIVD